MTSNEKAAAEKRAVSLDQVDEKDRHLKILSVGLPRTGSYSVALALRHLGYHNVYHILDGAGQRPEDWHFFAHAADNLFPYLPSYTGRGMSRADWDDGLFGSCEGITDIAGVFAESLIQAYPEAKVILVERDFEPWLRSIKTLLGQVWGRSAYVMRYVAEPIAGTGATGSVQRLMRGWLETDGSDPAEVDARARKKWETHGARIKEMVVPEERLLVLRIEQGWEPLCEFLDKPVPDMPFPHGNDSVSLEKAMRERRMNVARQALARVSWWVFVIMVVWAGVNLARSRL